MTAFTNEDASRLDFQLIVHGGVTLFHRRAYFEEACAELVALGYAVHELDVRSWERFRESVSRVLRWKDPFGYEPWNWMR